ncbi:MAG TPA: LysR family transcriptional regulator [Phenylobacterium sp.]
MLDKLEFLIALARERHFRRAAERCGVSQPTLSAGIKQLEETLGAPLVNRGARYIGLTHEGERVLEWARRLTGDARTMRQEVQVLKRGVSGVLRLAAIPTALPVAARLCNAFTHRHPEVRVTVLSSSSKAILTMLEDFEIDAGVTYLDNEPLPNATTLPLYRERYRLVTARDNPLGARETVAWSELASLPLCLFTRDMQNRRIVDEILAAHAGPPAVAVETNSSLAMAEMVGSGRWSSIMPPVLIDALPFPATTVAVPIVSPEVTHSVGLAVMERDPLTPLVRALIGAARDLAAQLD